MAEEPKRNGGRNRSCFWFGLVSASNRSRIGFVMFRFVSRQGYLHIILYLYLSIYLYTLFVFVIRLMVLILSAEAAFRLRRSVLFGQSSLRAVNLSHPRTGRNKTILVFVSFVLLRFVSVSVSFVSISFRSVWLRLVSVSFRFVWSLVKMISNTLFSCLFYLI